MGHVRIRTTSISRSLTACLILAVSIVSTLSISSIYFFTARNASAQLEKRADEMISYLGNALSIPIWALNDNAIGEIANTFAQNELVAELRVLDHWGTVLLEIRTDQPEGIVHKSTPISHGNTFIGTVEIHLSTSPYDEEIRNLLLACGTCLLAVILTLAGITRYVIRRLFRNPLELLQGMVSSYASGNYATPEQEIPFTEFRKFVTVLQEMGIRIATQINELREAEAKYRTLFENALEGIFRSSPDGRLLTVNPSLARAFGYSSPEDMTSSIVDVVHQCYVDPQDGCELTRRMIKEGPVTGFEAALVRKDGSHFWVSVSATAIRNVDGQIIYFEGYTVDITDRRKAEQELDKYREHLEYLVELRTEELQENQRLLSALMSSLPGMAYRCLNDRNRTLLFASEGALELTGYLPEELSPGAVASYSELIDPQDRERLWGAIQASLEHRTRYEFVYGIKTRWDRRKWVLERGQAVLSSPGTGVVLKGFVMDITAQKEAETALQKARDEASQANKAKSEFLAMMSHEIRTPMNAIMGMTTLLLDTQLDPRQRSFSQTVLSSTEALLSILNDILDFSKIEAGKLELECRPFDVLRSVKDVMNVMVPRAEEKGIHLHADLDARIPRVICGDITRLRQVLSNLISNAVKFTNEGEIILSLSAKKVTGDAPALEACEMPSGLQGMGGPEEFELLFSIRDTGIGIPFGRMHRLFGSFTQVDPSTTRRYGGTGLGLAICKHLCEMMGGRIWVESTVGEGSTFSFTLRATAVAQEAPAQDEDEDLGASEFDPYLAQRLPLRILVVEDNFINQQLAILTLERLGYEASVAANGLIALDALNAQPHDVVLMDIQMPEMDGIQATLTIRSRFRPEEQPYIIAMTANAMKGDREECLAAGMNDYIAKPVEVQELIGALSKSHPDPNRSRASWENGDPDVTSGASRSATVDGALKRLRTVLGNRARGTLPTLIHNFLRDTEHLLTHITLPPDKVEIEELRRMGYPLKSSCAAFGAERLAELWKNIEDSMDKGAAERTTDLRGLIALEWEEVKKLLHEECRKPRL